MTDRARLDFLARNWDLVNCYLGEWSWTSRIALDPDPTSPPYPHPKGRYHGESRRARSLREAIDKAMRQQEKDREYIKTRRTGKTRRTD